MKNFRQHFGKNKDSVCNICGNPVEIPINQKELVSRVEVAKIGKNGCFGNSVRKVSIRASFHLVTIHGDFFD